MTGFHEVAVAKGDRTIHAWPGSVEGPLVLCTNQLRTGHPCPESFRKLSRPEWRWSGYESGRGNTAFRKTSGESESRSSRGRRGRGPTQGTHSVEWNRSSVLLGAWKFSEKEQSLLVLPPQSALSPPISTGPIWPQPSK